MREKKIIIKADWDSNFFGYAVGAAIISNQISFIDFQKESSNFRLIYVFSKKELGNNWGKLVDKKCILSLDLSTSLNTLIDTNKIKVFDRAIDDIEQLKVLALKSGEYSRFRLDSNFVNNEFERLYLEWLEKSVSGILSLEVLVAKKEDRIAGFITINRKSKLLLEIGLIAVHEDFRNQGIAKELIQECKIRAKLFSFERIQVATQGYNEKALLLYKSCNFKENEIIYIYHYWNL